MAFDVLIARSARGDNYTDMDSFFTTALINMLKRTYKNNHATKCFIKDALLSIVKDVVYAMHQK